MDVISKNESLNGSSQEDIALMDHNYETTKLF
jgi:hypothetical protein